MTIGATYRNKILDAFFNNVALQVAQAYLSLHTADPGSTGASEVTGGTYARQLVDMDAASAGAITNAGQEEFTGMPACTVTHFGFWDVASGGNSTNYIMGGALSSSRLVNAGDTFRFAQGDADANIT